MKEKRGEAAISTLRSTPEMLLTCPKKGGEDVGIRRSGGEQRDEEEWPIVIAEKEIYIKKNIDTR